MLATFLQVVHVSSLDLANQAVTSAPSQPPRMGLQETAVQLLGLFLVLLELFIVWRNYHVHVKFCKRVAAQRRAAADGSPASPPSPPALPLEGAAASGLLQWYRRSLDAFDEWLEAWLNRHARFFGDHLVPLGNGLRRFASEPTQPRAAAAATHRPLLRPVVFLALWVQDLLRAPVAFLYRCFDAGMARMVRAHGDHFFPDGDDAPHIAKPADPSPYAHLPGLDNPVARRLVDAHAAAVAAVGAASKLRAGVEAGLEQAGRARAKVALVPWLFHDVLEATRQPQQQHLLAPRYYQLLGLPVTASSEQIKAAHRAQALRHHPDRRAGRQMSQAEAQASQEAMQVLNEHRELRDQLGGPEHEACLRTWLNKQLDDMTSAHQQHKPPQPAADESSGGRGQRREGHGGWSMRGVISASRGGASPECISCHKAAKASCSSACSSCGELVCDKCGTVEHEGGSTRVCYACHAKLAYGTSPRAFLAPEPLGLRDHGIRMSKLALFSAQDLQSPEQLDPSVLASGDEAAMEAQARSLEVLTEQAQKASKTVAEALEMWLPLAMAELELHCKYATAVLARTVSRCAAGTLAPRDLPREYRVLGVGATASVAELKAARQAKRWSMAALGARAAYRQLKREAGRRDVDMAWLDNMVQREMMSRLRGAIDQFWESNI